MGFIQFFVTIIFLIVVSLLGGCVGFDAVQTAIATQGAKAEDQTRTAAEFLLCDGISVGAWRRAYGLNPERSEAYKKLCETRSVGAP